MVGIFYFPQPRPGLGVKLPGRLTGQADMNPLQIVCFHNCPMHLKQSGNLLLMFEAIAALALQQASFIASLSTFNLSGILKNVLPTLKCPIIFPSM